MRDLRATDSACNHRNNTVHRHANCAFYPPGSCELAEAVAACAKESKAVLLQNHGLLTIGKDLLEASKVALALEDSAKTSMLCSLLSPKPAVLPEHAIQFVREYFADKE